MTSKTASPPSSEFNRPRLYFMDDLRLLFTSLVAVATFTYDAT